MKEWKTQRKYDGTNAYMLVFGHHLKEPEVIACLFRGDEAGDWYTTSDMLRTNYTWLAPEETDDEARLLVEEMIQEHYEGEIRYYKEILDEFKRGDKE